MTMRIRIIILSFLLISLTFSNVNADANKEFNKANELYSKKKYEEAIVIYKKIESNGSESMGLYFNLGNAYFKNGEIEKAILYYEKAKLLDPNNEDLNFNLGLSYTKIADKIEPVPEFILLKFWNSIVNSFNQKQWMIVNIIVWLLTFGSLFWFLLSNSVAGKKISFLLIFIFLVLSATSGIAGYSNLSRLKDSKSGIIFQANVDVKSSPDESGQTLFVVHKGTKILLLDQVDGWVKMKLLNGNTGWLRADDFSKI